MVTTFGEINYTDEVPGERKPINKDLFLKLDSGDNEIRLLTSPFQYLVHKLKKDLNDKKDFGQKVYCSAPNGDCPCCKHPNAERAKARYLYGVIDRRTGAYKILDVSSSVFQDIKKLANAPKWGDPTKYDINIIVNRGGGPTGYYTVQANPKEPLSAADQHLKDTKTDLDELKRRSTPPEAHNVLKRMEKVLGEQVSIPISEPSKSKTVVDTTSSDDEDFPDYDAQ